MSHGFELEGAVRAPEQPTTGLLAPLGQLMGWINRAAMGLSMLALLAAAGILSASVFLRYFLKMPTDWQDEMAVFLLVGSTFMCGAYVQAQRGHVGIEALASMLPAGVNRIRMLFVDFGSFLFCGFFSWKSWTLFYEALHEGHTTSSTWAPPLWIPYGLMSLGMTLLTLQLLIQSLSRVISEESKQ